MRAQGTSDGATGDIISLETAAAIAAVAVHEATAEEEHTEHLEAAQDAGRIVSWRLHQAPLEMRAEDSRVLSTRVCAIRCTDSKLNIFKSNWLWCLLHGKPGLPVTPRSSCSRPPN